MDIKRTLLSHDEFPGPCKGLCKIIEQLNPITEVSGIEKLSDDEVEIQLKFKEMQNP